MRISQWVAGLLAAVSLAASVQAQTVPTFTREQRLSRFHHFLAERKQALYDQGARSQSTPASAYPNWRLLHPDQVTSALAYAINRYDSYQARVQAQAASEDLVIRPVAFGALTPATHVTPEGWVGDDNIGRPGNDATAALQSALDARKLVWLTSGRTYELSAPLRVPSGANLVSDGSATILVKTGPGTAFQANSARTTDGQPVISNQPIQIIEAGGVVLRDFRVRMAADSADIQPLLRGGILIWRSSDVRLEGLELLGFPRTLGIVRVGSSAGVALQENLIHGGYTSVPTRQVTGIEVDNDRAGETAYSTNLKIVGNFILGVMMDDGVVYDTGHPDRQGFMLGYETDGINIQTNPAKVSLANLSPVLVANNSIMDVGEGIDTFDSNGVYRNNHIERAFAWGLKVIHGASSNKFAANRIIATGLSSIVVTSVTGEPTTGSNSFVRNRIRFTNAFNTEGLPAAFPKPSRIGAIDLSGYTTNNSFHLNEASEPMNTGTQYVSGVYCSWPSPSAYAHTNLLWKNGLAGFPTTYNVPNGECVQLKVSAPLIRTTSYEGWTVDGLQVEQNVRYDYLSEQPTTDRHFATVPGAHEVRIGQSLGAWQNRQFTLCALVRRGSNAQIMLRDQITDWYMIFDLNGEGSVVGPPGGSMVTGGGILRLTDDWYHVAVRFAATGDVSLLTLRQLQSGPGVYLDVGETRFDAEE